MTKAQMRKLGIRPEDFDVILDDTDVCDVECIVLDDEDDDWFGEED